MTLTGMSITLTAGPPGAHLRSTGATRYALSLRRSPGLTQTVRVLLNGSLVEDVHLDDDAWRTVEIYPRATE